VYGDVVGLKLALDEANALGTRKQFDNDELKKQVLEL
jgi:hypothetical protein